ncbi:hypothetical protein GCM10023306_19030 [Novosphingobium ginsenosidimutans]
MAATPSAVRKDWLQASLDRLHGYIRTGRIRPFVQSRSISLSVRRAAAARLVLNHLEQSPLQREQHAGQFVPAL